MDSPSIFAKITFSFQMQDQIPLEGDVQLMVIQNLNAARGRRFSYDSNNRFRRHRKKAGYTIGAEEEHSE